MNSLQMAVIGFGTAIILVAIIALLVIVATVLQWLINNPVVGIILVAGAAATITKIRGMW